MKKIITQGIMEEAIYYCDKHPEKECFSELKAASWYGSKFDMTGIEIYACDECLQEVYNYLENQFQIKPKEIEL